MVKGISAKMLHIISQSAGLEVLCSDIGDAFVNAYTTEKYRKCCMVWQHHMLTFMTTWLIPFTLWVSTPPDLIVMLGFANIEESN
eukprot:3945102-Ditylum_brightwellii.AAC.1